MSETVGSDQTSEKSLVADFANIRVKLSTQKDNDVEGSQNIFPETKPLPVPQEISPRPPTHEEGHNDGDVADYLSE